jgi:hypothetical protein
MVVFVELTLVVVPLTVKLPPIVTSLEKAPVVAPEIAPPLILKVPSVNVSETVTFVSEMASSRLTVNV